MTQAHAGIALPRADWLDLHREEIVDPDLPIIDAHHHLWVLPGSTCRGAQLAKDFRFYLAITEPAIGVRVRPAGSGVVRGGVMGAPITGASSFGSRSACLAAIGDTRKIPSAAAGTLRYIGPQRWR